ncbi:MAG: tetratricopeptide repeat protein [Alphaproteobacteria bacterium]|nr:tetratricopeptide repeat protein [Alphaproteobacteria bacterium]
MASLDTSNPLKIHAAAGAASEAGRFREAEGLYRQAISVAESQMGASHPHVAKMAISLVDLYENQGRYDEARQLCERVIGQIDPAEAAVANDQTLARLTDLCRRADQLYKAAELYREAMAYRRQVFGNVHGKVAACIAGMAETYRDLGNVAKARSLLLRAISMAEEAEDDSIPALEQRLRELRQTVLVAA